MTDSEPKIIFRKLKGFPALEDHGKIQTEEFLASSKEIVTVIESFGRLFTPIVYDMNGNIQKITKTYEQNKEKYCYLDHIVSEESKDVANYAGDALLWLKRALELIAEFFHNIINDPNEPENLKECLQCAYDKTLKPFHGWIVQNTFALVYRWVPNRSQLVGTGAIYQENVVMLKKILPLMKNNLERVNILLVSYNLDSNKKV